MKQLESETDSVPESQRSSSWWRIRRWLGFVSTTSQREGNDAVSTAELERFDPLGGNWEERKAAEAAKANRFFLRRWLGKIVNWILAEEPNLATFDTMLKLDEGELRNPPQRTSRQQQEIDAAVAAFEGFDPKTGFYKDFLSRQAASRPDAEKR